MTWQATITLWAVMIGACLGALYDLFRLSRVFVGIRYSRRFSSRLETLTLPLLGKVWHQADKPRKRTEFLQNLYVAIGDVVYFLLASATVTVFLYHANNGIFRWYLAVGLLLGFLLYRFSVGKLVVAISELFAFAVYAVFRYVLFFTLRPLTVLGSRIAARMRFLANILLEKRRLSEMKKYTKNIMNTLDNFREIM